jgi:hypothetical protein
MVERAGYAGGFAEVEILSRSWWARDPDDVLDEIKRRHQTAV